MTWDQMKDEIKNVVRLFDEVYSVFGLTYQIEVSTMPEDHMGDVKDWDFATETLKAAVTEMGKDFIINEGDGAFYGPKLDFHLSDSLGRTWQCGTIQLDMQLPERFELEYTGADGEKHRPVMIHRVVLGSIERFIGVITEHFAGAFPLWLAPVQIKILPIADRHHDYAKKVCAELDAMGFRVEVDERSEKIGYKIREAQLHKIPYMLLVGDKRSRTAPFPFVREAKATSAQAVFRISRPALSRTSSQRRSGKLYKSSALHEPQSSAQGAFLFCHKAVIEPVAAFVVTVEEKALHAGAVRLLRHEARGYALLETVDEAVGVLGKGAEALLKRQIELAVVVRHSREEFGVIGYEIDYRAAEIDRVKDDGGIIRYHQAVFILPCGAVGADAVVRDIQQAVVASEYRMIWKSR